MVSLICSKIVDKIDKDNDGFVTEEELIDWIKYVQHKYITDDTNKMWDEHDIEADGALKWESYRSRIYGYEHGMLFVYSFEPCHEKTCLRVLRPGKTQTCLLGYSD